MYAVHVADGLLSSPWWIGGIVIAIQLVIVGLISIDDDEIPRIGLLTAALFVSSQLHLPLVVTSVHLLLNAIAGILLGRYVGLSLLVALGFQFFLFGHGGLWTLGVNIVVMGLPAFLAFGLFAYLRRFIRRSPRLAFPVGAGIGFVTSTLTVTLNGLIVRYGLTNGGYESAIVVVLAHLPVIAVETAGTGVIVAYLAKVKPEWLKLAVDQPSTGVTSSNGTSH